ncbi:MAG: UDP-N-acetylglucosamine 2-epimerase (hydrolyzing) [Nanoarchaeota archaeon]|nr:UDP-N-acetylglucosamine 2-epimerase (hydrolyzing) [Nanoarchaeota archaeon]
MEKIKIKIVFVTGTRADFGKLKPLMNKIEHSDCFECYIFATGMHVMVKYGFTVSEIQKNNYEYIYSFINQSEGQTTDIILSNTIIGFGNYIREIKPDMIVVHGDRIEALGAAMSGALNNILVAHIEGGEVSGTIDESMRHSITKMSHIHFVSNNEAKNRIIRMGEDQKNIFVIGSPEIDIMLSKNLPSIDVAKRYYEINFDRYSIFIYHPVTTEQESLEKDVNEVITGLINSGKNYVVIHPNNDPGSEIILNTFRRLENNRNFRLFSSLRFEYYLTLLKNSDFIIGNSSSGVREAGIYGVPSINIGSRQKNRSRNNSIINVNADHDEILRAIGNVKMAKKEKFYEFGEGKSADKFFEIVSKKDIFNIPIQKRFCDICQL